MISSRVPIYNLDNLDDFDLFRPLFSQAMANSIALPGKAFWLVILGHHGSLKQRVLVG